MRYLRPDVVNLLAQGHMDKKTRSGVNLSSILCNSTHARAHTSHARITHTVTTFSWRKKNMTTLCKWKQAPFHLEDNHGFDAVWINNFRQLWISLIFYLWCLQSYFHVYTTRLSIILHAENSTVTLCYKCMNE